MYQQIGWENTIAKITTKIIEFLNLPIAINYTVIVSEDTRLLYLQILAETFLL